MEVLRPEGWPRPKGYSVGVKARGEIVYVAGQIGWDVNREFQSDDLADQVRRALENIAMVLQTGGAEPDHIVRMTWYVTDMETYRLQSKEIGEAYRAVMGHRYPAMTLVQVVNLVEPRAKVEIEVTAVIPDPE